MIHTGFDFLAMLVAIISGYLVYRWRFKDTLPHTASRIGVGYMISLALGSVIGAYLFGTLNLHLSDIEGVGRSILGSLAGAILTVEIYKFLNGVEGSTGYVYVVPFSVVVIIGRIGCLLSGLHDQTHGIETVVSWGWNFGDGILRHPVQLYESLSMTGFLLVSLIILCKDVQILVRYGFYLCTLYYALQRFFWEFLKPYGDAFYTMNTFQLLCLVLIVYSVVMIIREQQISKRSDEHLST